LLLFAVFEPIRPSKKELPRENIHNKSATAGRYFLTSFQTHWLVTKTCKLYTMSTAAVHLACSTVTVVEV